MSPLLSKMRQLLQVPLNWYTEGPRRALDLAYEAALRIQKLEEEHFEGNPVSPNAGYGVGSYTVFRSQLRNHLNTIRLRLVEYQLSTLAPGNWQGKTLSQDSSAEVSLAQKLELIDLYLARYQAEVVVSSSSIGDQGLENTESSPGDTSGKTVIKSRLLNKSRLVYSEQSFIPVSFLLTFQRIKNILFEDVSSYEQEVVDEIDRSRRRTIVALRFFVLILLITIVTQISSKLLIYNPLIDAMAGSRSVEIRFGETFKQEALEEFRSVRENLEIESLLAEISGKPLEAAKKAAMLQEEAKKLIEEFNHKSLEGIKNLCADLTAALVLYGTIFFGKKQLRIIKDFLYETLEGLSDSAKAFLIIVCTDTFVGYHSSDGWDAMLTLLFRHYGAPESTILSHTFIATVPVFLDALFKFWIFQYLRRASPPTSAIYREMND